MPDQQAATSTFTIRQATLQDIPLIQELAAATWEPTYRSILSKEQLDFMYHEIYSTQALTHQFTNRQHTFLLLYLAGKPVGFASFGLLQQEPVIFKLQKIYLLPETQGKGAGKILIKAVEAEAKKRKATALQLNVNRYNPAQHFYRSQGYSVIREEDIPIGPYWMNDFVMEKNFQGPTP